MSDWIQVSLTWDEFYSQGLNKPGTIIEVKFKDHYNKKKTKRQFLIGDINTNAGVCDDCTAFDRDAKVMKYKPPIDER